jgi:hypothetical protein
VFKVTRPKLSPPYACLHSLYRRTHMLRRIMLAQWHMRMHPCVIMRSLRAGSAALRMMISMNTSLNVAWSIGWRQRR